MNVKVYRIFAGLLECFPKKTKSSAPWFLNVLNFTEFIFIVFNSS